MSSEFESEESLYEYDVEEEAVSAKEIQVENNVEEEAMSETEENQAEHNSDAEEQETERNDEHEVEQEIQVEESQETTNKKKRSWVWDYFTYDNTTKKAKCIHCKVLISCNKGCTSGMSCHINSKHKLIKEKGKKQLTINETINNSDNSKVVVSIIFISSLQ